MGFLSYSLVLDFGCGFDSIFNSQRSRLVSESEMGERMEAGLTRRRLLNECMVGNGSQCFQFHN